MEVRFWASWKILPSPSGKFWQNNAIKTGAHYLLHPLLICVEDSCKILKKQFCNLDILRKAKLLLAFLKMS